jgi:hypothetical protein
MLCIHRPVKHVVSESYETRSTTTTRRLVPYRPLYNLAKVHATSIDVHHTFCKVLGQWFEEGEGLTLGCSPRREAKRRDEGLACICSRLYGLASCLLALVHGYGRQVGLP